MSPDIFIFPPLTSFVNVPPLTAEVVEAKGGTGTATAVVAAVLDATHVVLEMNGKAVTMPLEAIRHATRVVDWSTLMGNREVGES